MKHTVYNADEKQPESHRTVIHTFSKNIPLMDYIDAIIQVTAAILTVIWHFRIQHLSNDVVS